MGLVVKIAIIGLGQMGRPIALNLHRAGEEIVAFVRPGVVITEMNAAGVETDHDFGNLGKADFVLLCLPDSRVINEVLFGGENATVPLRPGQTIIDLGTTDHAETLMLSDRLGEQGVNFLDAPVSGMAARAAEGALTVMCGGDRSVFERTEPILRLIGSRVLYLGPTGSGQLAKLINQLLFDINAAALAEVLPLAAKLGLDPRLVAEVINSGTGRSFASEFFLPRILRRHFSDGYPMQEAYKDLVSGARLSAELCIPMPVLAAATGTYQTALLAGHGRKDKGGMILPFEQLLDVAFQEPAAEDQR